MSGHDICSHAVPMEEPCEKCLQDYMKERKRNARIQAIADLKAENNRLRARVAELEADRERAWTHYAECANTPLMADVMGERDTLRARVAELEAALEQHWEHALRCPAQRVTEDDDSSCNCGLWQILAPKQ